MNVNRNWWLFVILCFAYTPILAGSINDTVWTKRFTQDVWETTFSHDGKIIAVSTSGPIFLVSSETGIVVDTIQDQTDWVCRFTLDDKILLYYSNVDKSVHRYNIQSKLTESKHSIFGIKGPAAWVEFSYDGNYLIADVIPDITNPPSPPVYGLGWVVVDTRTGEVKQRTMYPTKPYYLGVSVNKVFLTQTGDTAIAEVYRSYGDGQNHWTYTSNIIMYDVATGDSLGVFPVMGYTLFQSNNNQHFAIVEDSILTTVNTKLQITHTKNFHNAEYHLSSISDDGNIYALARYMGERTMEVWDLERNEIIWKNNIGAIGLLLSPIKNHFIALYSIGISYYKNKLTTSVSENLNSNNLLFPNPTTGELRLSYSLIKSGEVNFILNNLQGIEVLKGSLGFQETGEHSQPIMVNMLPSGAYYLRLQTPDGITMHTISVVR